MAGAVSEQTTGLTFAATKFYEVTMPNITAAKYCTFWDSTKNIWSNYSKFAVSTTNTTCNMSEFKEYLNVIDTLPPAPTTTTTTTTNTTGNTTTNTTATTNTTGTTTTTTTTTGTTSTGISKYNLTISADKMGVYNKCIQDCATASANLGTSCDGVCVSGLSSEWSKCYLAATVC